MDNDSTMILIVVVAWTIIYGTFCLSFLTKDKFILVVAAASAAYMGGLWVVTEVRENLYDTVDWCIPYEEEGSIGEGERPDMETDKFPRINIDKWT